MLSTILKTLKPTSRVKLTVIGVLLAVILTSLTGVYLYVGSLKRDNEDLRKQIATLSADNSILKTNNATLKANIQVAEKANATNVETINSLLKERQDAAIAIKEMANKDTKNMKKIKDLRDEVLRLKGDKVQDGALAPVLKDTIIKIQNTEQK